MPRTATKLHVLDCGSMSCDLTWSLLKPGRSIRAWEVDLADEGTMLFTSDAIYMGDSYGPPAMPAAIVNDLGQWYASVEKLRGIAERSDANVIFGHDAEQLWSLRRSPDGYYT
jgi:N-acyl homoserine lactone hydrolase